MPINIEIKAKCRDPHRQRQVAASLATAPVEALDQTDTFFIVQHGRLKLRQLGPSEGELIFYERSDVAGPKSSSYAISHTDEPAKLRDVLAAALGVQGVIRKRRTVYFVGQTRIHFDQVDGLGDFLELEVVLQSGQGVDEGVQIAKRLMEQLRINESDLIDGAYVDLLRASTTASITHS